MKGILLLIYSFLSLVFVTSNALSSENLGLPNFNLNGGERGFVPFPHRHHQNTGIKCDNCHNSFPKHLGAIEKLINNGVLSKKYVMNKLCIACHKKNQQEKNDTGPIKCKDCHVKT